MEKKLTVEEYFRLPETNRPQELVYGYLREPPGPTYGHQRTLESLLMLLRSHVIERNLGMICFAPLDVVLDQDTDLVVQPDLMFISNERSAILRERVWGAPDLVIEVASPSSEHRDRTLKLAWYQRYGVRECWLVYPQREAIEVVSCQKESRRVFTGGDVIQSDVLPEFTVAARECFR